MADIRQHSCKVAIFLAWLVVGVPFAWGVYNTLLSSVQLFHPAHTVIEGGPK